MSLDCVMVPSRVSVQKTVGTWTNVSMNSLCHLNYSCMVKESRTGLETGMLWRHYTELMLIL